MKKKFNMKVLFLGSHCDDIELGCGATIHKHRNDWQITCAIFMVDGTHINYPKLSKHSEAALNMLGVKDVRHFDFPVNEHYNYRQSIWEELHSLDIELQPDLVITQEKDQHQDHCTLYSETLRNFYNSSIWCYRSSIKNCLIFNHNTYEVISFEDANNKLIALKKYFMYEDKIYFKTENLMAIMRHQGIYAGVELCESYRNIRQINRS
jgi:LmbE family N-acetylglucosaminyl deacetylase